MGKRHTVFEYHKERKAYVCGECGLEVPPEHVPEKDWNYCPGCGALIRTFALPFPMREAQIKALARRWVRAGG